jgi:hypothetical protein
MEELEMKMFSNTRRRYVCSKQARFLHVCSKPPRVRSAGVARTVSARFCGSKSWTPLGQAWWVLLPSRNALQSGLHEPCAYSFILLIVVVLV